MAKKRHPDDVLFDEILDQTLNIFRLSANRRAAVMKRLDAMSRDLAKRLQAQELSEVSEAKIRKVLAASNEIINDYYRGFQGELDLRPTAEFISLRTANTLQIALALDAVDLPRQAYFASVEKSVLITGSPAADYWRGQSVDTTRRFAAAVRTGLSNSETNSQIIARVVGKSGEPGVIDVSRSHAATLVQTSVQAVANDARRTTFESNDDVVKGFKQVSTLDSHTSIVCVSYSGASWTLDKKPIDKSPPWNGGCPRHFNCRSVEVPLLKSFRDLGLDIDDFETSQRASSAGPVDAKTTFDDFLKRQGVKYQDEVLGVGRAELWRKGKLTLRDLVSGQGRPLSLEELQRRFA